MLFSKKGVMVKGKDLKNLFHLNKGVLIYKDNKLVYIACDDPIKLVIPNLKEKTKEPITFISEEFHKVRVLNDDENYIINFRENILEVWDKNHQNIILAIVGIMV